MRMPDSDRVTFLASITQRKLQLLAYRAYFRDVIEKGNITESGAHAEALRPVVGDGGRGGTAVDVKQIVFPQHRHQLVHQRRVRRGLRALMIVHASDVWNGLQQTVHQSAHLTRGHAWPQLLRFRPLVAYGLHGQMQHDLIAPAMGLLGDLNRPRMIWQHRDGDRKLHRKDGVRGGAIVSQVIHDDGETSAFALRRWKCFARAGFHLLMKMHPVGYDASPAVRV